MCAVDKEKLEADWDTDPCLRLVCVETVDELATLLRDVHQYLTNPERGGPFAYLYRKQIERNRELQKELDRVNSELASGRR